MKKLLPLLFAMLAMQSIAQDNYSGFNYQAVVRNANGEPIPNQSVSVRFILGCGIALPYTETHSATSDARGLITLVIGEGTPDPIGIPSFDAIDWNGCGVAPWVLQVSMDITGGTNYVSLGSQQLKAVPFALNAVSADTLTSGVHWEMVGNDLQNTSGGPVRVMENMWVEGGIFLNNAVNFPDWDISGQTGSLTFNELFQGPRLTLAPGGNVGVGTDTPSSRLHIQGQTTIDAQGSDWLLLNDENGNPRWDVSNNFGSNLYISEYGVAPRLALEAGGNMGINTLDPDAALHVVGTFKLEDGTQGAGKVLTSDTDGFASWQTPTGGGGHWVASGNDIINSNSGNVGIGTPLPAAKLDVSGEAIFRDPNNDATAYVDVISGTTGHLTTGVVGGSGGATVLWNRKNTDLTLGTNDLPRLTVKGNGNIGIGVQDPGSSKLHVAAATNGLTVISNSTAAGDTPFLVRSGNGSIEGLIVRGNGNVGVGTPNPGYKLSVQTSGDSYGISHTNGSTTLATYVNSTGAWLGTASINHNLYFFTNNSTAKMTITPTGYVGIGTITPQSALAVNGKITAKEVEVTLAGFPDYVFEADYELMTLKEVEAYIKEHGHLPNVPSACEVEENGLGLGAMNKILLEKVEELTLHLIEQQKRLDEQAAMIQNLIKQ